MTVKPFPGVRGFYEMRRTLPWPLLLACLMALADLSVRSSLAKQSLVEAHVRQCLEDFDSNTHHDILVLCQRNADHISRHL